MGSVYDQCCTGMSKSSHVTHSRDNFFSRHPSIAGGYLDACRSHSLRFLTKFITVQFSTGLLICSRPYANSLDTFRSHGIIHNCGVTKAPG
jgi:hypothetical protein